MRAGPLSDDNVIDLLNSYFVPVYTANEEYTRDGSASPAEKAARVRMLTEAWKGGDRKSSGDSVFMASDAACYVLSPDGHVVDALRLPDCLENHRVIAMLERVAKKFNVKKGETLVPPSSQSDVFTPKVTAGSLALHLTARYIPAGGTWKQLPGEDIVVLDKDEWRKLIPANAKVGTSWEIDKDVAAKLLIDFYPPSSNREPSTNRIDDSPLKATVVSVKDGVARVRLDCNLRMKHRFLPIKDDDKFVEAKVVGLIDCDPVKKQIKQVRMVTEKATYNNTTFGVAVRSIVIPN
jgi:hypothetical protein